MFHDNLHYNLCFLNTDVFSIYGAGLEVDTYGGRRQRKNRLEVMDIAGLCST